MNSLKNIYEEIGEFIWIFAAISMIWVALCIHAVLYMVYTVGRIMAIALPWNGPWEGWPHNRSTNWDPLDFTVTGGKRPPEKGDWKFVLLLFVMGAVPIGIIYYVAFN